MTSLNLPFQSAEGGIELYMNFVSPVGLLPGIGDINVHCKSFRMGRCVVKVKAGFRGCDRRSRKKDRSWSTPLFCVCRVRVIILHRTATLVEDDKRRKVGMEVYEIILNTGQI